MDEPITRYEKQKLIPARMLNEFVYCPRLCYMEWVQENLSIVQILWKGSLFIETWIKKNQRFTK